MWQYMLACTISPHEEVALEACEFWLCLAETQTPECRAALQVALPRLLPSLLRCMKYTEMDIFALNVCNKFFIASDSNQGDEDDWAQSDRDTDVRPATLHVRSQHVVGGDDEEGEDSDDDDEDQAENWNLRKSLFTPPRLLQPSIPASLLLQGKCAAAALDVISTIYGDAILPLILPPIFECLKCAEWEQREASILAIGAIAEGLSPCCSHTLLHTSSHDCRLLRWHQRTSPAARSVSAPDSRPGQGAP
jgi:hypothetical protein